MTPRQHNVVSFIAGYIAEHGFSPTYAEIAEAIGMKCRSHVWQIVAELVNRNAIAFEHDQRGRKRNLRVVEPASEYQRGYRDGVASVRNAYGSHGCLIGGRPMRVVQ